MVFISDKRAALERMNERVKTGYRDACDKRRYAVKRRLLRINAGSDNVACTCYGCKYIFDYAKVYNINIKEENEAENKTKKERCRRSSRSSSKKNPSSTTASSSSAPT